MSLDSVCIPNFTFCLKNCCQRLTLCEKACGDKLIEHVWNTVQNDRRKVSEETAAEDDIFSDLKMHWVCQHIVPKIFLQIRKEWCYQVTLLLWLIYKQSLWTQKFCLDKRKSFMNYIFIGYCPLWFHSARPNSEQGNVCWYPSSSKAFNWKETSWKNEKQNICFFCMKMHQLINWA